MEITSLDPLSMIRPRRRITGMSAVLLPYEPNGRIDWESFQSQFTRTLNAGLVPAVNMDTGYVNLLTVDERRAVLKRSQELAAGKQYVAGAFVADASGAAFDLDGYRRAIDDIQSAAGTPVIFQSFGLTGLDDRRLIDAYRQIGEHAPKFIGFELGTMFAPFGRIYSLSAYRELLSVPQCIGAKHSSLRRDLEWQRLHVRDTVRPDFMVLTGNDLAIDMVMYGSDYLLGLSTFGPDLFAKRDSYWETGNANFYELNDLLQYLGFFAFRPPVPAYKHTAAQALHARGWIRNPETHPNGLRRPDSDVPILRDIMERLEAFGV